MRIWAGIAIGAVALGMVSWPLAVAAGLLAVGAAVLWQRGRAMSPHWAVAWMPASDGPFQPRPRGWHPDPYGHAEHRYWNGHDWTDRVATGGVTSRSPV